MCQIVFNCKSVLNLPLHLHGLELVSSNFTLHSNDLKGYALSTFANAWHEVCSRMSQLSNARSLVSKYVLDRSESKILWLYGFSNFFWCENTKNQICDFWTKFRSVLRFFANSCSFEREFGLEMQIKHFFINLDASW